MKRTRLTSIFCQCSVQLYVHLCISAVSPKQLSYLTAPPPPLTIEEVEQSGRNIAPPSLLFIEEVEQSSYLTEDCSTSSINNRGGGATSLSGLFIQYWKRVSLLIKLLRIQCKYLSPVFSLSHVLTSSPILSSVTSLLFKSSMSNLHVLPVCKSMNEWHNVIP